MKTDSLSHANSSSCGRMNKSSEGDNEKYLTFARAGTRKEETTKRKKKK
jgi:hypothetical protein